MKISNYFLAFLTTFYLLGTVSAQTIGISVGEQIMTVKRMTIA